MPAVSADQAAGRVRLQPPLVLAPIPHAILRTEHPSMALAVEHGQVPHGQPEGARRQTAIPALVHKRSISDLRLGEGVDGHGLTVAGGAFRRV